MQNPLRHLPSVSELLESPPLKTLVERVSHHTVASGIRSFLDHLRSELKDASSAVKLPAATELAERIAQWIKSEDAPRLRPVINATGVLLHTGLGRAPLADEAVVALSSVARQYSSLEVDLQTGDRSQRVLSVQGLLQELTGAEAATVVNNNAAATLLTLTALAKDREVIVSRGQLIEIGGSFRLPDVMTSSGARLREVGTTNKTRISDYADAINDTTAAMMRVHTSNYVVEGFTEQVSLKELIASAAKRRLPLIDDIGSGALIDFSQYGIGGEPVAQQSIQAGADVVLFSGDKLLGGPQCGIIVGRQDLIQTIAKHPMMRAMRVDKITLAALAATLRLYRSSKSSEQSIPLLSLLSTSIENLKNRAQRMAPQLAACSAIAEATLQEGRSMLGGGSMPRQEIPTWCIALVPADRSTQALAADLRTASTPVFGRVQHDHLLLDLRTVFPRQDIELVQAFTSLEHQDKQADQGSTTPSADDEGNDR